MLSDKDAWSENVGRKKPRETKRMEQKGKESGRFLDVSSNQRKPAGGTGRAGGVRAEHN